jgi:hypothetical protein
MINFIKKNLFRAILFSGVSLFAMSSPALIGAQTSTPTEESSLVAYYGWGGWGWGFRYRPWWGGYGYGYYGCPYCDGYWGGGCPYCS